MDNNLIEPIQGTEPGAKNIRERLQRLAQQTAALNECIARVEKNLQGASEEASSSGLRD